MRALLVLLLATGARATTIPGGDYGNTPLHPANGDVLSGTFTNVSLFQIDAGATVFVAPATHLAVYASTISISGVLDGNGRGESGGGGGGTPSGAGQNGFDADAAGTGGGGAAAGKGGGGGAAAAAGGVGSGAGAGAGGSPGYGSTGTVTIPLSADDAYSGSGGGGGGATASFTGGSGGAGGAAVYLECSSMTLYGSIQVNGSTAATTTSTVGTAPPGAGGGGGGGTILLRVTGHFESVAGSSLTATGGTGGSVASTFGGTFQPGGGGAGGRVKVFTRVPSYAVFIATAAGNAGSKPLGGGTDASPPVAGALGAASFGTIASSPTAFAAQSVYVSSINWTWKAAPSFGDGPTVNEYRIFYGTSTAPLGGPETTSSVVGATVTALSPNTTYYRFITAYTDWGDSFPSNATTAYTLADSPALSAQPFPAASAGGLTLSWTSGVDGNPSYTQYEVNASSVAGFGVSVSTSFVVGLSSAASNLLPNTTYYFRARAVNVAGIKTDFTATATTATWAATPASPAFNYVFVTSASVNWSKGGNPSDTQYLVEVSSDNFFSVTFTSRTLMTSATFTALSPAQQTFFRVSAYNRHNVQSSFSTILSTVPGVSSDLSAPASPGTPVTDRQFSYDGTVLFAWSPATSGLGILDYHLIVGTLPGLNDILNDMNVTVTSRALAGLASGRSYYAQVRARANNGVYSSFSGISAGLPVFNTAATARIEKPFTWPSPFDPTRGPAQIGFTMPEAGHVTIRIFTLQGKLVREQSADFGAGNQVASWNGQNGSGSTVAPGGYVVLIEKRMGGRTETQKLKIAVLY